jgi:hypothetical protein
MFEDIYRQAVILSDGHPEELTIGDLCPPWSTAQMSNGRMRSNCLVLATDEPELWQTAIARINKAYSKPDAPAPNYLTSVGGPVAVQRFIDSHETFVGGKLLYSPYFFTDSNIRKFGPFDAFLRRKHILQGVSISAAYYLIN